MWEKLGKSQCSVAFSTFFIAPLGSIWGQVSKCQSLNAITQNASHLQGSPGNDNQSPGCNEKKSAQVFHQPLHKAPGRPGLGFSIVGGSDCPGGALGIFVRCDTIADNTTHEDRPRRITSSPPSSGQCFLEVKQRWRRHQGSKKVAGE